MSSINIEFEINTDNAAFADDKELEINDIVFNVIDTKFSYENDAHIPLKDSNGNFVGYAKIRVYKYNDGRKYD